MSNILVPATPGLPGNIQFVDIYHGDEVDSFQSARWFGLYGVVHKATQGVGPGAHDPLYHARRAQWLSQPPLTWTREDQSTIAIPPLWGAYDFNTGDPVKDQVTNFLAIAQPDAVTLLCLDFEDNKHSQMTLLQACEWLQRVHDQTGQRAKIYSGNRMKEAITRATGDQLTLLAKHDFWLCQYGPRAVMLDSNHHPLPWKSWWAWQRDADGFGPDRVKTIPGIRPAGKVDEDVFLGTPEELMKTWVRHD